jgi:hypothetical protein
MWVFFIYHPVYYDPSLKKVHFSPHLLSKRKVRRKKIN